MLLSTSNTCVIFDFSATFSVANAAGLLDSRDRQASTQTAKISLPADDLIRELRCLRRIGKPSAVEDWCRAGRRINPSVSHHAYWPVEIAIEKALHSLLELLLRQRSTARWTNALNCCRWRRRNMVDALRHSVIPRSSKCSRSIGPLCDRLSAGLRADPAGCRDCGRSLSLAVLNHAPGEYGSPSPGLGPGIPRLPQSSVRFFHARVIRCSERNRKRIARSFYE